MAVEDVREAAKAEIRRQVWSSQRGIATRTFIREHPEIVTEFEEKGSFSSWLVICSKCGGTGNLTLDVICEDCKGAGKVVSQEFPEHVTRASIMLELHMRARRREASAEAKAWAKDHPSEVQAIREELEQAQNVEDI
jgi:RecJ-like exonuclease